MREGQKRKLQDDDADEDRSKPAPPKSMWNEKGKGELTVEMRLNDEEGAMGMEDMLDNVREGPCLLDLPADLLQNVKKNFSAGEWARGPCQTCKSLHQLPWLAITTSLPFFTKEALWKGQGTALLPMLSWAGKRAVTLSLELELYDRCTAQDSHPDCAMKQPEAMPATAHWEHLRSFEFATVPEGVYVEHLLDKHEPDTGPFYIDRLLRWVFERAPDLENVSVYRERICLNSLALKNVRHLEICARALASTGFEPSEQLPMLERLCLGSLKYQDRNVDLDELNLAACEKLTHLALNRVNVSNLMMPPGCKLSVTLWKKSSFEEACQGPALRYLGLAEHIHRSGPWPGPIIVRSIFDEAAACGGLTKCLYFSMDADSVEWLPQPDNSSLPRDCNEVGRPVSASAGQLLQNLKLIDISAKTMKGTFPAGLPNLEEICIMCRQSLELSFEDPASTAAGLKSLLMIGHPIIQDQSSFQGLSGSLSRWGLNVKSVSAPEHSPFGGGTLKGDCSCVYSALGKLATWELFRTAYDFLQDNSPPCRCSACLTCLGDRDHLDLARLADLSKEKDQERWLVDFPSSTERTVVYSKS